jgi:hypothetical protein
MFSTRTFALGIDLDEQHEGLLSEKLAELDALVRVQVARRTVPGGLTPSHGYQKLYEPHMAEVSRHSLRSRLVRPFTRLFASIFSRTY